ncbi:MAG: PDZ domain-containing protein [Planctomycetes bacterium]|nr:PDZ domain-containing protein [Planctomycetota bacterium]
MKPISFLFSVGALFATGAGLSAATHGTGALSLLQADGGVKIRAVDTRESSVETHGEAAPANVTIEVARGEHRGDNEQMDRARRELQNFQRLQAALMAAGDLNGDERAALIQKAREKLDKDMKRLEERERENANEDDIEDRRDEAFDIRKDRYRASLRALQRDLLYRLDVLKEAGNEKQDDQLDALQEKITDTYADLQDKIDDGEPRTWDATLDLGRKFHGEYQAQIGKWEREVGADQVAPDVPARLKGLQRDLGARIKRLRKAGGDRFESQLDDVQDRVNDAFEPLIDKLEDAPAKVREQVLADGKKLYEQFVAELDKWAEKIGVDAAEPGPVERLGAMHERLLDRIKGLRKEGNGRFEDILDGVEDKVRDTYADLKDKILNQSKEQWAKTMEAAEAFEVEFTRQLDAVERKIKGGDRVERHEPEPAPEVEPRDYPEKDVKLPPGEVADVIGGVRVARLLPLPKKQLGLDCGLSVNEVVDADGVLAQAGLEVYDIILELNGNAVDTRSDLREALANATRGEEFTLLVMRDGKRIKLKGEK